MDATPVTLEGPRIRLEPLSLDHLPALCQIGLNPTLWSKTTIQVQSEDDMARYINTVLQWQTEGHALPFVVVEKSTGCIIGTTRFHHMVPAHRRTELGYTWLAQDHQGQGLNREMKYLMLRHAFETWGCIRVEFKADVSNTVSQAALISIGAVQEGILRNNAYSAHRGPRDLVIFSIIDSDWPAVKTQLEAGLTGS